MSRWEFMRRLEELLSDISPSEREEALQYYNDYFNDAVKNETDVLDALGSPEQVAKIVRDGLNDNGSFGEFTENGFTNGDASQKNAVIKKQFIQESGVGPDRDSASNSDSSSQGNGQQSYTNNQSYAGSQSYADAQYENKKEGLPGWAIALIVIACIIFSPAILGLACAAIALFAAMFCVVAVIGLVALILFVVAVALWIAGFSTMIIAPVEAIGIIGGGLICAAIGVLFLILTVFLAGFCIPGIFKGIGYICHSLFGKKGGARV